jgi:aspartyl-tRNA(Asn)/glutamyl-tRNA(Gln) amidotransferase subunit A
MDPLAGPDARDLLSLPADGVSYTKELDKGIKGKRLAWSADYGYAKVDPEVASICRAAAMRFAEAGAIVEEADLGWHDPYEIWSIFFFGVFAAMLEKQFEEKKELLDPGLRRVIEKGLKMRGVEFGDAHTSRHLFWAKVRTAYEKYDLVLSPTLAVPPFNVGQDDADPVDGKPLGPLQWTQFTYPFNLTGQPAISLPAGWTKSGLPVGLQIVGNRYDDLLVLQAARAFEQVQPWREKRPALAS